MALIETVEQVPATTRKREHKKCDACGAEQDQSGQWPAETNWGMTAHHDVTVKSVRTDIGYENDGANEGVEWDFCPKCFDEKVRPLLETIAQPRKVDETW